jgi:hypothetical protein
MKKEPSRDGEEAIEYIRQMLIDLGKMAASQGADDLSYMIDIARLEAERLMTCIKPQLLVQPDPSRTH